MGKLIYLAITSLDGYIEDANGSFEWAAPDEEVHAFANELARPISTELYGRRLYEVMTYWETALDEPDCSPVEAEYARDWQARDKVVFSRTLSAVSTARTTLHSEFDAATVRELKANATSDLSIGGAELAGQALRAGVVDEVQLLINSVVVGGGKRALPDDLRLDLKLLDERRFESGVLYLRYALAPTEI